MVELAIVVPVLFVFLMAVVDFGRVAVTSIAVSNAVKAGAQYGAQSTSMSVDTIGMKSAARADFGEASLGTLTIDSVRMRCRCPGSPPTIVACSATCGGYGTPHAYVVMGARRSVDLLFRYPGFPASIAVSRTAMIRAQ